MMEPWYKIALPRQEVREGRSFTPDGFAIALEQVVAGTVPEDYRDPAKFFSRTCFTRALCEHAGMVLRRLAGQTEHTQGVAALGPAARTTPPGTEAIARLFLYRQRCARPGVAGLFCPLSGLALLQSP